MACAVAALVTAPFAVACAWFALDWAVAASVRAVLAVPCAVAAAVAALVAVVCAVVTFALVANSWPPATASVEPAARVPADRSPCAADDESDGKPVKYR